MSLITRPTVAGRILKESRSYQLTTTILIALTLLVVLSPLAARADETADLDRIPYPTDSLKSYPFQTRGESELEKLDPELRKLHDPDIDKMLDDILADPFHDWLNRPTADIKADIKSGKMADMYKDMYMVNTK